MKVCIALATTFGTRTRGTEEARALLGVVVDALAEKLNCRVVLLGTQFSRDLCVLEDIHGSLRRKEETALIAHGLDPVALLMPIQNWTRVVGARLHSAILPVAVGVPVLALSYHPKVESFMTRIGQDSVVLPLDALSPPIVSSNCI